MTDITEAPWSLDQVEHLNKYQTLSGYHPYTCGFCGADLIATGEGWYCSEKFCDYKQNWVYTLIFDLDVTSFWNNRLFTEMGGK